MKPSLPSVPREMKILFSLFAVVLIVVIRNQFVQMDSRFLHPSIEGVKGLVLYLAGDYKNAAMAYRQHYQRLAELTGAVGNPGYAALIQGRLEAAKSISHLELSKDSHDTNALLTLGEIALAENPDRALDFFAKVLDQQTDQYDALLLSAVARTKKGAYVAAIEDLKRALRWNRTETRVTSFLTILEATGELADRPKDERPACLLAHLYRYLRIYDESNARLANHYAELAVERGDRPSDAYTVQAIIAEWELRHDEALALADKAITADPKNAYAHRIAATIYADRGDLANEYRMRIGEMTAAPTDDFYAGAVFTYLTEKAGDYYEGLAMAKRVLQLSPNSAQALSRVAWFHHLLGEEDQALEYLHRAIALEPDNAKLYGAEGLATSLAELNRIEDAIRAYRKASELAPTDYMPHRSLAELYWKQRRFAEGIEEYEQAIRLGDRAFSTHEMLCQGYDRLGQYLPAVNCYERVLAADPTNPNILRQLAHMRRNLQTAKARG